ncbi:MAG: class I SAM-dependent methyltransferase [Bdellovibrionota bacterium]
MRTLTLSKSGFNKIRSHQKELKTADLEGSVKSIPPGEWCLLTAEKSSWICFVNAMIDEKFACVQVIDEIKDPAQVSIEKLIYEKIQSAVNKRRQFEGYAEGSRVFYGMSDGLPGLIVDHFTNAVIIQINTAGVDRYRELIAKVFEAELKTKSYFLDNAKYREREFLPMFEHEAVPALTVKENSLSYHLRAEVIQKVGFYYDHRENRKSLQDILLRLKTKPKTGIDLFCYAGAWGMNALKGGLTHVDFVDQGDFSQEVMKALELNSFQDQGKFHRQDVFKFMDDAIARKQQYDLIMCDPPAFAKSHLQKDQALEGYSKLHRKVMKISRVGTLAVFSSCTHYVSHEEFQKNILDAANKEGRKIQLLHTGIQGWDHPIRSQGDKSNYIKSYFYILES